MESQQFILKPIQPEKEQKRTHNQEANYNQATLKNQEENKGSANRRSN